MILLLPFLSVAALFVITPGPDVALVTRNALQHGGKAALLTIFGVMTGALVWTVASAVGVAALLEANAFAFSLLRLAGAAYLGYLGVRALISLRARAESRPQLPEHRIIVTQVNSPYAQGVVNNVLNPKIAVLFTSLIPQFITPGPSEALEFAELAGVFAVMGFCALSAYAILALTTGNLFRHPSIKKTMDAITGTVLVALGIKAAVETR